MGQKVNILWVSNFKIFRSHFNTLIVNEYLKYYINNIVFV